MAKKKYTFKKLVSIMKQLRSTRGCAWDRAQNHHTLVPYLFEEAHEVVAAIKKGAIDDIQEELGDILLQVLFHAQIASENNHFTIDDVIDTLAGKLIRRHPHVYGTVKAKTPEAIIANWYRIKKREKMLKNQQFDNSGNKMLH